MRSIKVNEQKCLSLETERGTYYLRKYLNGRLVREFKVPKGDVEILRVSDDNYVISYWINREIWEADKKIVG